MEHRAVGRVERVARGRAARARRCRSAAPGLHRRAPASARCACAGRRPRAGRQPVGCSTVGADELGRAERRRVDVEGVLRHPRRMAGRVVERGEVVVVELDLGALHHPVAEPDEDVLDLAPRARSAGAGGRPAPAARPAASRRSRRRQRALELGRTRARASRALEQRLERLARLVAACADRAALARRGRSAIPRRIVGELGLAAQVARPAAPRARRGVARRGDRRRGLRRAGSIDPLDQSGSPRPATISVRSAIAAAAATLSDSAPGAQRDRRSDVAARQRPRRAARRARRRGRAWPPTGSSASSGVAAVGDERRRRGRAVASTLAARQRLRRRPSPCSRAPPSARTGRRSPARARPAPSPSAWAVRMIAPTLPGSATPCR